MDPSWFWSGHQNPFYNMKGEIVETVFVLNGTHPVEICRLFDHSWGVGVWNISRDTLASLPDSEWYDIVDRCINYGPVVFFFDGEWNNQYFQHYLDPRFPPLAALQSLLKGQMLMEKNTLEAHNQTNSSSNYRQPSETLEHQYRGVFSSLIDFYTWQNWAYTFQILYSIGFEIQQQISQGVQAGSSAIQQIVACVLQNQANLMVYGNFRYQFVKVFGLVFPNRALLNWIVSCFKNCDRVISIGSGTCFLETALQLAFIEANLSIQVICIENGTEALGMSTYDEFLYGFRHPNMVHSTSLPEFRESDGILISWGRSIEQQDGNGPLENVWKKAEDVVKTSSLVHSVVIIGDQGDNPFTWPIDRWCGYFVNNGENEQPIHQTWVGEYSTNPNVWENPIDLFRFHGINDYAVCWKRLKK